METAIGIENRARARKAWDSTQFYSIKFHQEQQIKTHLDQLDQVAPSLTEDNLKWLVRSVDLYAYLEDYQKPLSILARKWSKLHEGLRLSAHAHNEHVAWRGVVT